MSDERMRACAGQPQRSFSGNLAERAIDHRSGAKPAAGAGAQSDSTAQQSDLGLLETPKARRVQSV
jgi:hypothetical protein